MQTGRAPHEHVMHAAQGWVPEALPEASGCKEGAEESLQGHRHHERLDIEQEQSGGRLHEAFPDDPFIQT